MKRLTTTTSVLSAALLLASCGTGSGGVEAGGAETVSDPTTTALSPTSSPATTAIPATTGVEADLVLQSELEDVGNLSEFCGSIVALQGLLEDDEAESADFVAALELLASSAPGAISDDANSVSQDLVEAFSAVPDLQASDVDSLPAYQEDLVIDLSISLILAEPQDGRFSTILLWANEECDGFPLEPLPEVESEPSIAGAEVFVDPEGLYEIEIDPGWTSSHDSLVSGVEVWYVGRGDVVAPNINILTQRAPSFTMQKYLDVSLRGSDAIAGFELIETGILEGPAGQELGMTEFLLSEMHFLQYYLLVGDDAVILTLTTSEQDFARVRAEVEPYLLTFVGTD